MGDRRREVIVDDYRLTVSSRQVQNLFLQLNKARLLRPRELSSGVIGTKGATFQCLPVWNIEDTEESSSKGDRVQDARDKVATFQYHAYPFSNGPPDAGLNGWLKEHRLLNSPFQEQTSTSSSGPCQGFVSIVGMLLKELRFRFREQMGDSSPDEPSAQMMGQTKFPDQHITYRSLACAGDSSQKDDYRPISLGLGRRLAYHMLRSLPPTVPHVKRI